MAKLISQLCSELQPVVCLPKGERAVKDHLSARARLANFSQKQTTAKAAWETQHQYLSKLLVNAYSYR